MSDVVLKVENISKQYRLGQLGTGTISHDVNRWWHKIRGKEDPYLKIGDVNDRSSKGGSDYVWSLKDINFEVKRGEVLGVIGKNGAGKSTLLKILSQVTTPTTGEIKVKGRIASLLEVGTGFHPDLTGKENVFLNGAILGMSKAEIKSKLDEIVEFSGVAKYLDTPVKRYSSGMMVRLGFAVAAHLEPEILIVDEVLAVGDIEFQKKCLGKMKDVSSQGRTVLFVSHNMGAIKALCTKGLLLENGQMAMFQNINPVVDRYLTAGMKVIGERVFEDAGEEYKIKDLLEFKAVRSMNSRSDVKTTFDVKDDIAVEIEYEVLKEQYSFSVHYYVRNESGEVIFVAMDNKYSPYNNTPNPKGVYREKCIMKGNFFNEGNYSIDVLICVFPTTIDGLFNVVKSAICFNVTDDMSPDGVRGSWYREWPNSIIRPDMKWLVEKVG